MTAAIAMRGCLKGGRHKLTAEVPRTIDLRQRATSDESGAAEFQIAPRLLRGIVSTLANGGS